MPFSGSAPASAPTSSSSRSCRYRSRPFRAPGRARRSRRGSARRRPAVEPCFSSWAPRPRRGGRVVHVAVGVVVGQVLEHPDGLQVRRSACREARTRWTSTGPARPAPARAPRRAPRSTGRRLRRASDASDASDAGRRRLLDGVGSGGIGARGRKPRARERRAPLDVPTSAAQRPLDTHPGAARRAAEALDHGATVASTPMEGSTSLGTCAIPRSRGSVTGSPSSRPAPPAGGLPASLRASACSGSSSAGRSGPTSSPRRASSAPAPARAGRRRARRVRRPGDQGRPDQHRRRRPDQGAPAPRRRPPPRQPQTVLRPQRQHEPVHLPGQPRSCPTTAAP